MLRLFDCMLMRLSPQTLLAMRAETQIILKMDYPRYDILLAVESETEYWVRLHSCKKEPETVWWIESFLKEGDVLYDIGANVGAYSLVASKFTRGMTKIYAFEPGFSTFAQLCRNVLINKCEQSVIPLPIALSNETRLNTLNYSTLDSGGSLHSVGDNIDHKGQPFTPLWRQTVLCYRLDELIEQLSLPIPNHIKLDVDGHELAILQGGQETLMNSQVKSLLVELNEQLPSAEENVNLLCRKGFTLHSKHKIDDEMYNVIFVRKP